MRQTAIEWLQDIINKNGLQMSDYLKFTFQQAKEMEKEQMINAYANGHNDGCRYMNNEKQQFEHAEDYYNETYGGNK